MEWLQRLVDQRPATVLTFTVTAIIMAFVAGASSIFVAFNMDRVSTRLASFIGSDTRNVRAEQIEFTWARRESALESYQMARIDLGDVNQGVMGGGVHAYGDGLLYTSSIGVIGYLDLKRGDLRYLEERVPMDYQRVRNEVLFENPKFRLRYFRVQDILVHTDNSGQDWLYVSHHQMAPGDKDVCQAIHRIGIRNTGDGIALDPIGWEHVYTVKDCINLPAIDWRYIGDVSGGRMVSDGPSKLLYSVGTYMLAYEPGGFDQIRSDDTDFGKIIEIDLETGEAAIYARGFRNPQGLVRSQSGAIWESEHGPKGGDEINLIERDVDYGWPVVTYGLDYGSKDWPFSENQSHHDGFRKPVHAFPVSVAPTQLVEVPETSEFVLWRGDLIMGSLRAQSLFRLRTDGDRLITTEQLEMNDRIRDLAWLENGWLGALADDSAIWLMRTAPDPEETPAPLRLAGYTEIDELEAEFSVSLRKASWGLDIFRRKCATCHNLDDTPAPGPGLAGIVGAEIGRQSDYSYSPALLDANGLWTKRRLRAFFDDPQNTFPGTTMPSVNLSEYEERALLEFLANSTN